MMEEARKPYRRRLLRTAALCGASALAAGAHGRALAQAGGYPSRPIRLIVPFNSGSGTDAMARVFARLIGERLRQPVTVENKAGANGVIAAQAVLNAPADGHTVFFASNSTLSTNAALIRNLPYDPVTDFAQITLLAAGYCAIVVPSGSPYKTLAELVADARKRPGALNVGVGSTTYALWSAWFSDIAKIKSVNVNYKGAGDVVIAIGGGQLDYGILDAGNTVEQVKGGRLRALVYTGPQRLAALPGVQTSAEAGFPEYEALAWTGVAVAAKTPTPIVRQLEAAFVEALGTQEARSYLESRSNLPLPHGASAMRKFQEQEIARWKRLVAEAGIVLE